MIVRLGKERATKGDVLRRGIDDLRFYRVPSGVHRDRQAGFGGRLVERKIFLLSDEAMLIGWMQLDPIEAELLDLLDGFNGIFRIRENSAEAEELWMLLLDLFGKAVDGAFLAGPGRDM